MKRFSNLMITAFFAATVALAWQIAFPASLRAMKIEFSPIVYVSEDYTDNYDQVEDGEEEEYFTTAGVSFKLGFVGKHNNLVLDYSPEYKDYIHHDENDTLEHNVNLDGVWNPVKHAMISYGLSYDDYDGDNESESWGHDAYLQGDFQPGKHTSLMISDNLSNSYDRAARTGKFEETRENTAALRISQGFGENSSFGAEYEFFINDYENPDADEYKSHKPSVFLSYWFTPQWGLETNASCELKRFDLSDLDEDTWEGDIRLIKKLTRHFQIYLKYAHTYNEYETGTAEGTLQENFYNPSAGFDWSITEDSGISLGAGWLIEKRDNQPDEEKPFVEADIYKTWDFSRRGSFGITASSSYNTTDTDAASLGFNINYQAGALLTYKLTRRLSSSVSLGYTRDEYDESDVDRNDQTLDGALGLVWSPLRWLRLDLTYEMEKFETDSPDRDDFLENRGTFKVSLIPLNPIPVKPGDERIDMETKIFNDR